MINSSLVELLRTLTAKELKSFKAFVGNSFHGPERYPKEAMTLLGILSKHSPNFYHPELDRSKVYHRIFPKGNSEDGRLDRVKVELQKCLRSFLLYERYFREEQEKQAQLDFAKILVERNLLQRADIQIKALKGAIEAKVSKTNEEMAILYNAARLEHQVESRKNTWRKDLNIHKILHFQDLYFFTDRINFLLHFLVLNKFSKVDSSIDLVRERVKIKDFQVSLEDSLDLFIAKQIFELYEGTPSIQTFNTIFDLLKEHEENLNKEDIKQYFAFLRNHCGFSLHAGNTGLWPVLHDIQKDNLQKGYFYHADKILPGAFFTISNAALMARNFEWASEFLDTHQDRIIGDNESKDFYRLGLANLLFYQQNYNEALGQIPTSFPNLDYHLAARRLELMVYHETDSALLPYKIDAFKMYLSRNRNNTLSEDSYEMNLNFINLLDQLSKSASWDVKRGEKILQRIADKKQLVAKEWLVQKAKKLAKR
jgi:hypothetical protein